MIKIVKTHLICYGNRAVEKFGRILALKKGSLAEFWPVKVNFWPNFGRKN